MNNTLYHFVEGINETPLYDENTFAELEAIESEPESIEEPDVSRETDVFAELEAIEYETPEEDSDFWGGVKIAAGQMPSMVTDVIPETIGRAIRRGDENIVVDSAVDLWIKKNEEEREKAKTLTPEERGKLWFKDPLFGIEVKKGVAEDMADSVGYSLVNMAATFGAKATTAVALAPLLSPIGSMIAATAVGFGAGTAVSQGATKDQFVDMVKGEFLKEHEGEEMTQALQDQWQEVYNEVEGRAEWYGFWEAAPETAGNLLTLGIAKLKPGKLVAPIFNKLKKKGANTIGRTLAKKLGVPVAKLSAMLTEESLTETITQKKQADVEFETGLRDETISYSEAFKEVWPMVLTTTPVVGGGIAGGAKLAERMAAKKETVFDDLELIEDGKEPLKEAAPDAFKKIKQAYIDGNLSKKDLEDAKAGIPDTEAGEQQRKQIDDLIKEVPEFAAEVTPEDQARMTSFDEIEFIEQGKQRETAIKKKVEEVGEVIKEALDDDEALVFDFKDDIGVDGLHDGKVYVNGKNVIEKLFLVTTGKTASVENIKIKPQAQKGGVGTKLYLALAKELSKKGITLVSSDIKYGPGLKLWESLYRKGYAERIGKRFQMKMPREAVDEEETGLPQEILPEEQMAEEEWIESVGTRIFGDTFEKRKVKIASETDETKSVQNVSDSLKMSGVVFFDASETQLDGVNGFYDPITKKIYVNKNTEKPMLVVFAHESLHELKDKAPDLYKKLISTLRGKAIGLKEYTDGLNSKRKEQGLTELTDKEILSEEFVADFASQAIPTADFWNKLNAENPTTTRKLAEILINLINQLRKTFGVNAKKQFKDIDAVEALAKTYAEYAKRTSPGATEATGKEVLPTTQKTEEVAETTPQAEPVTEKTPTTAIPEIKSTLEAVEFGKKATPEEVEELKKLNEKATAEQKAKLQESSDIGTKAQFLNEAIQASEGRDFEKKQREEAEKKEEKPKEEPKPEKIVQPPASEKVEKKPEKIIPPDTEQLIKVALDEDINYIKKVRVGKRTTSATKNAGEALSEVTEQRDILKRILGCV